MTIVNQYLVLENDEAHQDIAFYDGFCEDFYCFRIKEK